MLVMALDVGTSSARALCFDVDGRAVPGAEARVAYEPILSSEPDASARGAAVLALEALGAPVPPPLAPGRTFAPDPRRHDIYRAARERQQRLYDNVVGPRLS